MDCELVSPSSSIFDTQANVVSVEHRIQIIFLYAECGYNAEEAARRFNNIYAGIRSISGKYIRKLVKKFCQVGSVQNLKSSGRKRTTTSDDSADIVLKEAQSAPNLSINKIAQRCHTSAYAVRRIIREQKLRKFKVMDLQLLRANDAEKRLLFCSWFLEHRDVFSVVFTDEAVFYLNGKIEKLWYWSRENPRRFRPCRSQSNPKLLVWAGILGRRILGPHFITGTINGMLTCNFILIAFSSFIL